MTYNEWRDELKSNLLCVSETERRRVLDYYAEAYADRRDAGFTEREIIADFGAPYDAAQKILNESAEDIRRDNNFGSSESNYHSGGKKSNAFAQNQQQNGGPFYSNTQNQNSTFSQNGANYSQTPPSGYGNSADNQGVPPYGQSQYAPPPPQPVQRGDYTWLFVIICIVCAVPLFGLFMTLIGITIAFIAAPFGIMIGGIAAIGGGIGMMFSDPISGAVTLGSGLMLFGVSLVLIPLFTKLIKLMWTLLKKFFVWAKNLFSGRGQTI